MTRIAYSSCVKMYKMLMVSMALLWFINSAIGGQSPSLQTIYIYSGKSAWKQLDELSASHYKLGLTKVAQSPVYNRASNGNPALLGTAYYHCATIYLDRFADASFTTVSQYPGYSEDHTRRLYDGDSSIADFGSAECVYVLSLSEGTIVLRGLQERRLNVPSKLAITGGTLAYSGVRGEAYLKAVDAQACEANIEGSASDASCQLMITFNFAEGIVGSVVSTLNVTEFAGAQELTNFNKLVVGDRMTFGNPLSSGGYTSGLCYTVNEMLNRYLCEYTLVINGESTIAVTGVVNADLTVPSTSTLAVIGGTGDYLGVKGSASRRAAPGCVQGAALLTTDCRVLHSFNLTRVSSSNNVSFLFYEYGGATVSVNFPEVKASSFKLGESFYFGGPLKNAKPTENPIRIGFDGGYCWKTYLDKAWNAVDLQSVRGLPGYHNRGLPEEGAWNCYWTSTYANGTLTVMGVFADSGRVPNTFAVVGGTGIYSRAIGRMYDVLANPETCFSFGFQEASSAEACLYGKTFYLAFV